MTKTRFFKVSISQRIDQGADVIVEAASAIEARELVKNGDYGPRAKWDTIIHADAVEVHEAEPHPPEGQPLHDIPVCNACGSPDVTTDATAHFDFATRDWVLTETSDSKRGNWCANCEGATGWFAYVSASDLFDVLAWRDERHASGMGGDSDALEKRLAVPFAELSKVMGELTEKHGYSVAAIHEPEEDQ